MRRLASIVSVLTAACAQAADYTFVQVSDPQIGRGGFEHDVRSWSAAVTHINHLNVDFVVVTGDMVEEWDDSAQIEAYVTIAEGLHVPCFVVPGNHDVGDPPFFTPTPHTLAWYRAIHGPDYYSFSVDNDVFIVVNTNFWRSDVPQETADHDEWLVQTLSSAQPWADRIFVLGHHPLYSTSPLEPENTGNIPPAKRAQVMDWFTRYGVDAYLAGHRHLNVVHHYGDMDLITTAATSVNFGPPGGVPPLGFRVFRVQGGTVHEYTAIRSPDLEFDGDVDGVDFAGFSACTVGPVLAPVLACTACDLDFDADVDFSDWSLFQRLFTGGR